MSVSETLEKLECRVFIAEVTNGEYCACGRRKEQHSTQVDAVTNGKWRSASHCESSPSDAFGTIYFDGPEPNKAHFARLSSRSSPELVFKLLTDDWQIKKPKLIISIHGGKPNFGLAAQLKASIRDGILRTVKTTGAWIFTEGINTGISRRVGAMLKSERSPSLRGDRVVCVGIAPWGAIENRHQFTVRNRNVVCSFVDRPRSNSSILNSCHTSFLLVDNGTVSRHGAEIGFRRKLEKYIMNQDLAVRTKCTTPMICLVMEGGIQTIRRVVDYVSSSPPVPVVVCDGSGRAADLIALVVRNAKKATSIVHSKAEITAKIRATFGDEKVESVLQLLVKCVDLSRHIEIFRPNIVTDFGQLGEVNDLGKIILRTVLRTVNEPQNQLSLALAWNRADIARSEIFYYGQEWPEGALEEAMMYALDKNRIDFVKLLIEKGVQMTKFLTIPRLEELYNSKCGPPNTLQYIVQEVRGSSKKKRTYTLVDIGLSINKLMGGTFRSLYTKRKFRRMYKFTQQSVRESAFILDSRFGSDTTVFSYPFNDLLMWAVLTKRQDMAQLLWEHNGQMLAKTLVACNLYRAMASEAAEDVREVEHYEDFNKYYARAHDAALQLFDYCYRKDADLANKLLTVKWTSWSRRNCLQLAHACGHQELIAHPCSQRILTDTWLGGMNARKSIDLKVISSIFFFPLILTWDFSPNGAKAAALNDDEDSDEETVTAQSTSKTDVAEEPTAFEKFVIFYKSPISTYWADVFAYIVFLAIFTYTMLIKLPRELQWNEYYVIAYIGTFGCDLVRQVLVSRSVRLDRKISSWTRNLWNLFDAMAVLFFVLALSLRMHPLLFDLGRVIYCLNIIYWYLRVLRLFAVSKLLGPFVTMIFKMIRMMVQFIVLLLVAVSSYGVFRQALLYPNEERSWKSVRNVFFEPHLMIYGEMFAETIDPPCGEHEEIECVPGQWLNPLVMAGFLLISSVLLLNVLIAIFNSIYEDMNVVTHQIWKFNRYAFVIEYKKKPNLPPPLILFSHIYLIFNYFRRWGSTETDTRFEEKREDGIVEDEDQDDVELLSGPLVHRKIDFETELEDFEAMCSKEFLKSKKSADDNNYEGKYRLLNDKIDVVGRKLEKYYSSVVLMGSYLNLKRTTSTLVQGTNTFHAASDSMDGKLGDRLETDGVSHSSATERSFRRRQSMPEGIMSSNPITAKVQREAHRLRKLEDEEDDTT